MKDFIKVLRIYLPPYKSSIVLNVVFNVLSALFGIFSFISFIPVLRILFELQEPVNELMQVSFSFGGLKEYGEAVQNNIFYYITQISNTKGASVALVYIGLFLVLMVMFKTGFAYLASFSMVNIRNNVVRDIRQRIFRKIISLPLSFFSNERKGDVIARMTGDVGEIEVSIMNSLDMFFKNPIIIIISITTMLFMSVPLTLFVFILFPLAGTLIGRIGKSLKKRSKKGQNKMGEILSSIEETLGGLRIIKAFTAERKVDANFNGLIESFRNIMNKIMWRRTLAHPVSEFLGTIIIVIVMWYGGRLILENENNNLKPDAFLVYLVVFYSIINPAKAFSQAYYTIQKGLASIERIDKILEAENNITEKPDAKPLKSFNSKVEFHGVYFKYVEDDVLKDINIRVNKGESIALVGQSGSGKSTLVDLIPRFYDPYKGKITIDDIPVTDAKLNDLRELMGIVNQEAILFNDTIFNNIAFGVENATEQEVIAAAKVANAHEFIVQTPEGYQTNIGDRGNKLSGGQRQRLSIARAVLKNPPILILDEATSALDTESEKLVQEALTNLMKNRTSIVIAHRLSTITHADKIYVLEDGKIVESGSHDELVALEGKYKRFFDLQNFS
jgi:subfamily B ATP-binding cassette protein MsbA